MLPSFCRDVVTVKRATLTDKRGTSILDWTNPQTFQVARCSFQNITTSRDDDGRTLQVTDTAILYAPIDADLQAGDRIEYRNSVWEITGAPIPVPGATGNLSHFEIPLAEWRG